VGSHRLFAMLRTVATSSGLEARDKGNWILSIELQRKSLRKEKFLFPAPDGAYVLG